MAPCLFLLKLSYDEGLIAKQELSNLNLIYVLSILISTKTHRECVLCMHTFESVLIANNHLDKPVQLSWQDFSNGLILPYWASPRAERAYLILRHSAACLPKVKVKVISSLMP